MHTLIIKVHNQCFLLLQKNLKRDPECEVYFATEEVYNESDFAFKRVFYSFISKKIALAKNKTLLTLKCILKDSIKFILGKHTNLWKFNQLTNILPDIDLIVDVSGYNLGEKWPIINQEMFLDNIRIAKKYKIPMILMPQSFGPFHYDEDKQFLLKEIKTLLAYPDVIYAREEDGYNALTQDFLLTNVKLSTDLVLQHDKIDTSLIYNHEPEIHLPDIVENNCVAIVPNNQCFNYGNSEDVLNKYKTIINELILADKEIYILRHSRGDLESCRKIYAMYQDNKHVHLLENDFTCIEYDLVVKKFQFIVCSRFHGVVHAYRNGVPCIILGWAIKYIELAKLMSQSNFVFNIVDQDVKENDLIKATRHMIEKFEEESATIKENVSEIQKDNCFSVLDNYL